MLFFEEEKKFPTDETADEEKLLKWERHTCMKDGKEVVYFYNTETDKSQWHSPFPEKPIRKRRVPNEREARHKARSPPRRNVRSGQNSLRDRGDTWHSQEIRSNLWTTTCTTLML